MKNDLLLFFSVLQKNYDKKSQVFEVLTRKEFRGGFKTLGFETTSKM